MQQIIDLISDKYGFKYKKSNPFNHMLSTMHMDFWNCIGIACEWKTWIYINSNEELIQTNYAIEIPGEIKSNCVYKTTTFYALQFTQVNLEQGWKAAVEHLLTLLKAHGVL